LLENTHRLADDVGFIFPRAPWTAWAASAVRVAGRGHPILPRRAAHGVKHPRPLSVDPRGHARASAGPLGANPGLHPVRGPDGKDVLT